MRATDYQTLTSTSGAFAQSNPFVNGLLDPFGNQGTGQPLYYDQLVSHYGNAVVVGSKVTVQFHNSTTTTPVAQVVGLYRLPFDHPTVSWDYEYLREASFPGRQRITTSDMDVVTFSMKTSCKKYFNTKDIVGNPDFEVDLTVPSECSRLGYYIIFMQSLDQTTTSTCQLVITVDYIVLLKDPNTPARSVV